MEIGEAETGRRLQQQLQLSDLSGRELLLPKPTVSVPDRQWSDDAAIRGSGDSGLFDARGSAELSPHGAVQFAPVGDDHHKQAAGDEQHSGRPDGNRWAEAQLAGRYVSHRAAATARTLRVAAIRRATAANGGAAAGNGGGNGFGPKGPNWGKAGKANRGSPSSAAS